MAAGIARARLKLQLDVSFGDPITPEPTLIDYPQYLSENSFQLFGYPIATVIAEKLATAVALGDLNTRDRDYADLYRLICSNDLDGNELATALHATAVHRGIQLRGLKGVIQQLPRLRQRSYAAWRRRQGGVSTTYPDSFSDVVDLVVVFADRLLEGRTKDKTWSSGSRQWKPNTQ